MEDDIEAQIVVTLPPRVPLPSLPSQSSTKEETPASTPTPTRSGAAGVSTRTRKVSGEMRNGSASGSVGAGEASGSGNVGQTSSVPQPAPAVDEQLDKPRYIQPDHFYPTTNHMGQPANLRGIPQIGDGVWLTPEEDPQALRGIPVFKPTMEEFQDFEGYAKATTEWGQYSGITKIIPPAEWLSSCPPIPKSSLSSVRIRTPIQQNLLGSSGLFRIANVVKNKSRPLSVEEWFKKCQEKKFAALGPKDVGRTLNRDSKEATERRERVKAEMKRVKDERREKRRQAEERKAERAAQAAQGEEDRVNGDAEAEGIKHEETADGVPPLDPSGNSPHSSPDPHPTTPDSDSVEPWYRNFDPTQDWLPRDTRPEDYTVEACAALERQFWKNMGLGEPSWYGADMEGSLFVDEKTPWNVANLPNLLNRWDLSNLPGVNSPYLYFGMWGASFAWHVEDMDLFSINYIHFGAPKFWYAVPQLQAEKFERVLQGYFSEDARHCDQFLRHKSFAVSPYRLANDGINVNMLVHNQGEFVITYPRGYHAGFNMGFNCAESVNFALESWVELGRRAKTCSCVSHSVRIDVDEMLAQEERRINGEQDLLDAIEAERKTKKPRKRQTVENGDTPRKRSRKEPEIATGEEASDDGDLSMDQTGEVHSTPVKMPVMRKKKPNQVINISPTRPTTKPDIVKANQVYPCLFCPGLNTEDLLPVLDPSDAVKNIWKPRTAEVRVHHSCALAMPGVGIEDREVDGKVRTFVLGADNIEQARWNLKCAACADKRLQKSGAKIQCTKGKCPRAYHVSCAKNSDAASLKIWEVEIPILPAEGEVPLPEGAEIPMMKDIKVELLCPQHNPEKKAQLEQKKAEAFRNKILSLPIGSRLKIKIRGGASMEFTLVDIREQSEEVVVRDDGGAQAVHPWTSIDFRPAPIKMLENEYARVHTHVRRSSETRSAQVTPTAIASVRPTTTDPLPHVLPRPPSSSRPVRPVVHPSPSLSNGPLVHPPHPIALRKIHPSQPIHPAPLRVDQMLNPQPDPIPSRVVLCEAPRGDYPNSSHPDNFRYAAAPPHPRSRVPPINGPSPHFAPPPVAYAPTGPHAYGVHYDHRDPYGRALPQDRPYYPPPSRVGHQPTQLGLSAQPPPFQAVNGYHPAPMGYAAPPPHVAPVRTYSSSGPSNGSYPTSSASGCASAQGSSSQSRRRSSNGIVPPPSGNGAGKIDLGLQRMQALMDALRPLAVPAIHLAGTNGKGSVSAILESCLMAAGLSTARYNSPHLIEPRDAIRINGQPPSAHHYAEATSAVEQINVHRQVGATTFEVATAAAYHLINSVQPPVDVMIIECGMGGARDATNVIPDQIKLASALTAVGLDHTSFLGNSILEIAEEKAKIAVPGGLLVVGPQPNPDAAFAANRVAAERGARVVQALYSEPLPVRTEAMSLRPFLRPRPKLVRTPLPVIFDSSLTPLGSQAVLETELNLGGAHQLDNLSLALTILHAIRLDPRARSIQPKLGNLSDGAIGSGVRRTEWAGRCSWLEWKDSITGASVPMLVDGAHNADSAQTLRDYIDSLPLPSRPRVRFVVALSASPGKSIESVLRPLLRAGDEVHLVEFTTPVEGMPWIKPVPLDEAEAVVSALVGKGNVRTGGKGVRGLEDALRSVAGEKDERLTVVCGSLYLVADAYRLVMR